MHGDRGDDHGGCDVTTAEMVLRAMDLGTTGNEPTALARLDPFVDPAGAWIDAALRGSANAVRVALVAGLLGACGRIGFDEVPVDAASDTAGAGDGSSATTACLAQWMDGSVSFSEPQELMALASTGDDRDPWISSDGLRLYFDRNPGPHGGSDLFLATRTSLAVDFTTASALDNLDTGADEAHAALNGDETLLVLSRDNTSVAKFQIFVSTRSDVTTPFPAPGPADQALVATVNATPPADYFDPFLSADGFRLYLAPMVTGAAQEIRMATRAAGQDFGAAAVVPMINSGSGDAAPALSLDERIIVFSSQRPAGSGLGRTNLWYATRQNATDSFSMPTLIPGVNNDADDGDPMLSGDGCTLYLASTRDGGNHHLFRAQVTR